MNLHGIVVAAVGAVNPLTPLTIRISTGYTTSSDGTQVPAYGNINVMGQVQPLTFTDIQQLDGLNIQGIRRAIYVEGDVEAIVRISSKGGDLVTLPDGSVWLTAVVLEHWPNWSKIAVVQQDAP